MTFPEAIREMAGTLIRALIGRGLTIATAESCTGGLICAALTEIPGSSAAVHGGFITYANAAKVAMIGVDEALLARHGAVSAEVAIAMAEGARRTAGTDVAIAVTGIAGPDGGSDLKPVGLVHFACATAKGTTHLERRFGAIGRTAIREAAVEAALELTLACVARADAGPR
jgi:nicotinamide-nucleotide amidase